MSQPTTEAAPDVLAEAQQARAALAAVQVEYVAAVLRRRDAFTRLHDSGWTMDRIASAVGLSKARVGQLIKR